MIYNVRFGFKGREQDLELFVSCLIKSHLKTKSKVVKDIKGERKLTLDISRNRSLPFHHNFVSGGILVYREPFNIS